MEAIAGNQFILDNGIVKNQNVALDLDTIVKLWGADLSTTWLQS